MIAKRIKEGYYSDRQSRGGGVGKSFLAKCLAYAATQAGVTTLFTSTMDMLNQLIAAEADHSLLNKLAYYQKPDLLVCDESGYLPLGRQG